MVRTKPSVTSKQIYGHLFVGRMEITSDIIESTGHIVTAELHLYPQSSIHSLPVFSST